MTQIKKLIYLPLKECRPRHIYKLNSRNLKYGVFNPKDNGFIGIRTKFSNRYLFTEYHWDTGPPYGTAKPIEDLGLIDDEDVFLMESYPAICKYCGQILSFVKNNSDKDLGLGKWQGCNVECTKAYPYGRIYKPLFLLLEELEKSQEQDV